jgi:oligoribonuclease NrnB/cAMP/cGMP phosphodiesterase (DHH superfamily)
VNKTLCIYHCNCADGFGAAWAVRHALGADNVEFHAGIYQDPPPDAIGRNVLIVDFSYKRAVIEEMASTARTIVILDHHKSAAEDLSGFPAPIGSVVHEYPELIFDNYSGTGNIHTIFDMERSGAGLAWDFFHPGQPRPKLINHLEDRDLWRFRLSGTREIQAAVFSYPYDFDVWDRLMFGNLDDLFREGEAIERKHHKDIAELVAVCRRRMLIGGHNVPVASLPYTLSSDAGHLMGRGEPFAACYWDTPDGRVFSLRSADDGLDVSAIAKLYGGGGHQHAAGFRVPFARLGELEIRA